MGSSMFSQIIPGLGIAGMPLVGGPVIAPVPKAQNNVSTFPGVQAPHVPYVDPAALMNAFANQANVQSESELRKQQAQLFNAQVAKLQQEQKMYPVMGQFLQHILGGGAGAQGTGYIAPDAATAPTVSPSAVTDSGGAPAISSDTADAGLPPEARALLDTIAGPESHGAYNIRFTPNGGTTFEGYDKHPQIREQIPEGMPEAGKTSDAAGRYQMLSSTFGPVAEKAGISDFSPVSQDNAAWTLAQDTYNQNTGRDLLADLQSGDTSRVGSALKGQWATLAPNMKAYQANLAKYTQGGAAAPGSQYAQADTGTMSDAGGNAVQPLSETPQATPVPGRALSPLEQFQQQALARVNGGAAPQTRPENVGGIPVMAQAEGGVPVPVTPPGASSPQQVPPTPAPTTANSQPAIARAVAAGAAAPLPAAPPSSLAQGARPLISPRDALGLGLSSALAGMPSIAPIINSYLQNDPATQSAIKGAVTYTEKSVGFPFEVAIQTLKGQQEFNNALVRRNMMIDPNTNQIVPIPGSAEQAGAVRRAEEQNTFHTAAPGHGYGVGDITNAMPERVETVVPPGQPNAGARQLGFVTPPVAAGMRSGLPTIPGSTSQPPATQTGDSGPVVSAQPPQAPPSAPPQRLMNLGPEMEAYLRGAGTKRGETEEEQFAQANTAAQVARNQNGVIENMKLNAEPIYTGPLAEWINDGKALLRLLPGGDALANQVASREQFVKDGGSLLREAVRQESSRAAFQEFQMIGKSLPTEDTSPKGLQRVLGEYQGFNDYKIAKAQAAQQWRDDPTHHGSLTGFETSWQNMVDPYTFVIRRMTPEDRQATLHSIAGKPGGHAVLDQINAQSRLIDQRRLAPGI